MPADFNKIAWFYDSLSQLIFGQAIKRSQTDLLHFIPAQASVLIIGGGTGWILEEIGKHHASGLQITYVDSSSKMIALAQKRNTQHNTITFITTPVELLMLSSTYDVIFTPYLFDMFTQTVYDAVIKKLESRLKAGGLWLYCDFYITTKSPVWQKALLRLMYYFFRLSCGIEAAQLPEVESYFSGYRILQEKTYCKNFIVSKAFKK